MSIDQHVNPPHIDKPLKIETTSGDSNDFSIFPLTFLLLSISGLICAYYKWRLPCTNIPHLEEMVNRIQHLINEGVNVHHRLLSHSLASRFQQTLNEIDTTVSQLKTQEMDQESNGNIFAWVSFRWRQVWEIDACYRLLCHLLSAVTREIEQQRLGTGGDVTFDLESQLEQEPLSTALGRFNRLLVYVRNYQSRIST